MDSELISATPPGNSSIFDFSVVPVPFCEDLSATLPVAFLHFLAECSVHNIATWMHH